MARHAPMGLDCGAVFEDGVEPIAEAIRRVAERRGFSVAAVQRAAGWRGTDLYRYLDGSRGLKVAHLVRIAKAMDYGQPGQFFEDIGRALRQDGQERAGNGPRTDSVPESGVIPWSEHRAVVRAFQAQIAALEARRPSDPTPENLDRLEDDAAGGDATQRGGRPEPGSGRSRDRGHGRKRPKS